MSTVDPGLLELAALQVAPQPWAEFKRDILPGFTYPMTSKSHATKIRQTIRCLELLNLADEGEEPRGIRDTFDLNLVTVARYVAAIPPGQSPWTIKAQLQILSTLASTAVKARRLAVNPFDIRPIGKIVRLGPPEDKRALSRDELHRLMELLKSDTETRTGWALWRAWRLYVVAAIAVYCGLRRTELLTLHVVDVDLDARVIRLMGRGPNGKGLKSKGSAQPVGIPDALAPILSTWLSTWRLAAPKGFAIDPECPWLIPTCNRKSPWISGHTTGKALGRLQAAGKRAGIPDLTFHMLRRTLATQLEEHGVGGAMIQRILRHASSQTTERHYRRADERNIADAVKELEF
jgi:integrase